MLDGVLPLWYLIIEPWVTPKPTAPGQAAPGLAPLKSDRAITKPQVAGARESSAIRAKARNLKRGRRYPK